MIFYKLSIIITYYLYSRRHVYSCNQSLAKINVKKSVDVLLFYIKQVSSGIA